MLRQLINRLSLPAKVAAAVAATLVVVCGLHLIAFLPEALVAMVGEAPAAVGKLPSLLLHVIPAKWVALASCPPVFWLAYRSVQSCRSLPGLVALTILLLNLAAGISIADNMLEAHLEIHRAAQTELTLSTVRDVGFLAALVFAAIAPEIRTRRRTALEATPSLRSKP